MGLRPRALRFFLLQLELLTTLAIRGYATGKATGPKLYDCGGIMNTRKDYWRAVKLIRAYTTDKMLNERSFMTNAFVDFFSADNPRFDEAKFRTAVYAEGIDL